MSKERHEENPPIDLSTCDEAKYPLESAESAQLADPDKQGEYRREYLAQLKRRACPGCGEQDEVF